tara:strand:+ start:387 stop:944 length:558 start_codon:yes stop_codon:yes gene_type:complete
MAVRSVATTSTINGFRTTFNDLSTDVGDLATLNTSNKSTIVAAINETLSNTASFFLRDATSSIQEVTTGDTLNVVGTSNEITATVSATDTLTIGLASTVSGLTSLSSATLTDGTLSINSGSISGAVNITASGNITDGTATLSSGSLTSAVNVTGTGTANFTTDVQVNSVSVATKPFAIAQAIALG